MDMEDKYWKQYEQHVVLYKFYLDIVVKINAFHFAISGAIFTFYFSNKSEPFVQWSLALPALLSLCLVALFVFGAYSNLKTRTDVFNLRDKLGLDVAPELLVLTVFLSIFTVANLLTAGGTIYVIFTHCV
ncbi:MAG: hypothetical protein COA46_05460 [Porticoccaceae bacterium]|nr:MAG: hypothetical protein COA46_05460 [Porticoccaceae bacterium]